MTAAVVRWNTLYCVLTVHALRLQGHAVDENRWCTGCCRRAGHLHRTGDGVWRNSAGMDPHKLRLNRQMSTLGLQNAKRTWEEPYRLTRLEQQKEVPNHVHLGTVPCLWAEKYSLYVAYQRADAVIFRAEWCKSLFWNYKLVSDSFSTGQRHSSGAR